MITRADKRNQFIINSILALTSLLTLLPLLILIMSSFSSEKALVLYGYTFWPKEFSFSAYKYILSQGATMARAYLITVGVTAAGTALSLLLTAMLAYPLSRKDFGKRNLIIFLIFFTMLFNGGLVPSYIMWTTIFHIKNTLFAYLLPGLLVNAFNVILIKNYFSTNIPPAIIEAAQIDCAGEFRIFFQIVMPLSLPILATIGLLTGLAYWNDWINGLYYIDNDALDSIQVILNRMLQDAQFLFANNTTTSSVDLSNLPSVSIRMAIAVLGLVPILVVYPFFQKYFVKGIAIGAVKG